MFTMMLRQLKGVVKMNDKPEIGMDEIPKDHLLVHLCNLQKLEKIAEIGVFGGNLTNRVLANCPSVKEYYAIDPWKVYIESYDRPPHARECQQEWWEEIYQKVLGVQSKFPDKLKVMRCESVKAAKDLKPEITTNESKFDAVYLDGIHDAPNLANDLWCWLPLIKDYGTICGHDYIKRYMNMIEVLEGIFEEDLCLWVINKELPRHAHRNQGQGGNWWIHLTPDKKEKAMNNIRQKYYNLLFMGNQDEVNTRDK
jgi:hypothetical protein